MILDIRLPDMNGIQVFEIIHAFAPNLPVIIITAHGTTETTIGAIQKGAYDYIYKPFDVPEMLLLIEEALRITGGNISRAAKLLGVTRPTLHAKIDKYSVKAATETK